MQAAAEENPMGRNATPADVVPAMAFLLSDEASVHHRRNAAGHRRVCYCLETTFRLARLGEDTAIIDFINENFDMRLPLLNRPELFHHYYAGRSGIPQFAVAEEDGRYVSAAGYILANTKRKPDIWSASGWPPRATTASGWN